MFIRKDIIVPVYVDDCILISWESSIIDNFFLSLSEGCEQFVFMDKGDLRRYLEVKIAPMDDCIGFTMSQPFLIEHIL